MEQQLAKHVLPLIPTPKVHHQIFKTQGNWIVGGTLAMTDFEENLDHQYGKF